MMTTAILHGIDHNQLYQPQPNSFNTVAIHDDHPQLSTMNRGESKDSYIKRLEDELVNLDEENTALRKEVRELRRNGRRSSKADLRKNYSLTEDDVLFSDQVMEFAQQYLFPRFKFLDQGWMEHHPGKKKSFSAFVERKLKIRPDTQFADEWDNIIAPAIVKKYTDMRCNVNNAVRRTFIGEYRDICVLFSFTILLI